MALPELADLVVLASIKVAAKKLDDALAPACVHGSDDTAQTRLTAYRCRAGQVGQVTERVLPAWRSRPPRRGPLDCNCRTVGVGSGGSATWDAGLRCVAVWRWLCVDH